ncbi:hypothetical protein [Lysinibacillus piscis]|uniref:Peptidase M1 membrane alanine aminopeptidase domain-containing protein n=1 Tax=Lysinibacillus piscis TaxID=2518931 RepID=A0ABQ5NLF9_9BACI|nr:hypothetical protein [Lysinibacillus sp. KH24]GLC88927.1 hypothetical protein LYSBPC_20540 [Lysinibacillus sp. KH24]
MFKFRSCLLILVFLLTACTQDTVIPKEQEKSDENIVVTSDGKTTFVIINNMGARQQKVELIKDELVAAYDAIRNSIQTDYVPAERINVYLNEGYGMSWGLRSEVQLYGITKGQYPLVHELTHSLLGYGYGNNFEKRDGYGYFTPEGFASYMEDKFGKGDSYSHQLVKFFIDSHKLMPISKLIDPIEDNLYFRPDLKSPTGSTLQSMSYNHAASFTTYLIDTYGLEKFEKIYNQKNVANKIEEVYGKNMGEIEQDWITFIKNIQEPINEYKIKMIIDPSLVEQIDSKYFVKE